MNYEPRKLAKTVGIFVEIENVKDRGVTFWPIERMDISHAMEWSRVFNVFYLQKYSHGFS